jgi:nucleoside-diphosphate-sugar epimerase
MKWTGVLPAFIDSAIAGRRLSAVNGAHADFLHVDDAARAVVRAAEVEGGGICNVAAGVESSVPDVARIVLAACGRPDDDVDVTPSPAARAVVDVTRMRELLGVAAEVSLASGVGELVAWRRTAA